MALLRSAATVGLYTLMSRVLGFVRDMLTAAFLGAGPITDAFFVAQRLPNLFRSLFAEGAFNAAFVPLFAGTVASEGRVAARRFAEDALAVLVTALFLFVAAAEVFAPAFVRVLAPGFADEPEKFALTVALARVTFPYLLYISLASLQSGVLNSVERFAAAAATPMLLNLFLIGAMLLVRPVNGYVLAWAITASGFAQFVWLMVSCWRAGLPLAMPRPRLTPAVKQLLRLMLPGTFGAGVTQLNLVVSTAIASLLPTGAVSYLYYADRLNQLPLGVVGIAVGTAILPTLSRQVRTGDDAGAQATQNRGLELALLLTLPAAVGLGVLAHPILETLFQRGAFDAAATAATAPALTAYAAGLPAFVLIKILAPGFFARRDTGTPVKIAALAMAVNAIGTVLLGFVLPWAHVGIAIAGSIAGWLNALALMTVLHRRGHFSLDRQSRRALPRIAGAAIGMGALLVAATNLMAPPLAGTLVHRLSVLAGLVVIGLASFGLLVFLLGAARWRDVLRRLRRQAA
ncbi:MAG TPA: murein biosynthesis integral membrane protein MurJ [Stellaceae bacterium]|nr:murein biosynthesis integral membrane protein MurJ [Stellaceae bacterium]